MKYSVLCVFYIFKDANIEEYIPLPSSEQFANVKMTFESENSLIPGTLGTQRKPTDEVRVALKLQRYIPPFLQSELFCILQSMSIVCPKTHTQF